MGSKSPYFPSLRARGGGGEVRWGSTLSLLWPPPPTHALTPITSCAAAVRNKERGGAERWGAAGAGFTNLSYRFIVCIKGAISGMFQDD